MPIWCNVVHSTDIDLVRHSVDQHLLELLSILEAQVATVHIIGQGEGELTLVEVSRVSAIIETGQ